MKTPLSVVWVGLLTSLFACVSIPGTDHKGLVLLPRSEELKMGEDAYREMLGKEKLSTHAKANAILARVGQRISAQAAVADFEWEFKLIESKEMNAFCLPGGKVAFYTGILPALENEGAMAMVMGHEAAHAVARHGAQRVSQGLLLQFGLAAVDAAVLKDARYHDLILGALGMGAQVSLLPFSRAHESEADAMGLRYAAAAGYDPEEAVRFWQRFGRATGGAKTPVFLSTHPSNESRIQMLQGMQAEAQSLYARSPKYGLGDRF